MKIVIEIMEVLVEFIYLCLFIILLKHSTFEFIVF